MQKKSILIIVLLSLSNNIFGTGFGEWRDRDPRWQEPIRELVGWQDNGPFIIESHLANVSKQINNHHTVYEANLPNRMKLTIKINRNPAQGGTVYKGYVHPFRYNSNHDDQRYFRLTNITDIKLLATLCEYALHRKDIDKLLSNIYKLKTQHTGDRLENEYSSGLSSKQVGSISNQPEKEYAW